MSASDANSAIYINDSAADIKKKVNLYFLVVIPHQTWWNKSIASTNLDNIFFNMQINSAVTGGRDNLEDQKKYGANLKVTI